MIELLRVSGRFAVPGIRTIRLESAGFWSRGGDMSVHTATIRWENTGPDMLRRQYSRAHSWQFDGGARIPASPSPLVVPAPWSDLSAVDPEEAFVASAASCHMLWFLHVLIDAGYTASAYQDHASGEMTRNAEGKLWISRITLRPVIEWGGSLRPSPGELAQLHHRAHEACFIAQSIRTEIVILPQESPPV